MIEPVKIEYVQSNVEAASLPTDPLRIAGREWKTWLVAALLSFFLASVLMSGWKEGLFPNLSYPFSYSGDFLLHSWFAQRATEGWLFENARSGYPFGSALYDFPNSDAGSLLLQKALGMLLGSYYSALNMYFLLGFPVTFATTYCIARSFGLNKPYAIAAATLYTFLPFHFLRLAHIFYTWYFVAPIYFFLGYSLAFAPNMAGLSSSTLLRKVAVFLALAALASFGVYYDAFGLIIVGLSLLVSRIHFGDFRKLSRGLFYIFAISFGAFANIAPTLIYDYQMGPNHEVAARTLAESEVFGLKLVQLLYPRANHRIVALRNIESKYSGIAPLVNENRTSALGLIGSIGLLFLIWNVFKMMSGGTAKRQISYFSLCALVLFSFGTIGGVGVIFADFVSPLIRAWNRMSVFIAFPAIISLLLLIQSHFSKAYFAKYATVALWGSAALITTVGVLDQTANPCLECNIQVKALFEMDRTFVKAIESALPKDSAVYQMPYEAFPEGPPVAQLPGYDLLSGFINSSSLRWSFAGMKGREGDLFYRSLSQEPLSGQLDIVRKLGFRGIYVDKRGYPDDGADVVKGLSTILGTGPSISRSDGKVVFFPLPASDSIDPTGLTGREIMQSVGYEVDRLGRRIHAELSEGIDFSRPMLPDFLRDLTGLSIPEPWGRWSDANVSPTIRFDFAKALPTKFTMVLKMQPFVPNIDQDIVVKVGSQEQTFRLKQGINDIQLKFDLGQESASTVEFYPHGVLSPSQIGMNTDPRRLGLGFIHLSFIE